MSEHSTPALASGRAPKDGDMFRCANCGRVEVVSRGAPIGPDRAWICKVCIDARAQHDKHLASGGAGDETERRIAGIERVIPLVSSSAIRWLIASLRDALAENERLRQRCDEGYAAHAASFGALHSISMLTDLEGEVDSYADMVRAVERLRNAGARLANIAYNLAQDDTLSERRRETIDRCRRLWDESVSRAVGQSEEPAND